MLKLNEKQVIKNATFTEFQEAVNNNSFPSLAGFTAEGQSSDGVLLFNAELNQWILIRIIFKSEDFDGLDAIEEYNEKQAEKLAEQEKKAKKGK